MERLEIEYKFTPKEIFLQNAEFYKERFTLVEVLKVLPFILGVFWPFLFIIGIDNLWLYLLAPVPALLSILLGFAMMIASAALRAKKLSRQPGLYGSQHKRLITSEGITRPYGKGEVLEKWVDMHDFRESKYFYYLGYTEVEHLLIPKSAFKSDKEIEFITKCVEKIKVRG